MNNSNMLMIIAGGTGGHIFPGITIAKKIKQLGWNVIWIGNYAGMEVSLVPQNIIPIKFIDFNNFKGNGIKKKITFPINLIKACIQSVKILKNIKPRAILSMGCYIAFPTSIMALLLGYNLIIHEQNSVAGLSNKILSKFTKNILSGFPNVFYNGKWTGNPIPEELIILKKTYNRYSGRNGPLRILIIGGSTGSIKLNNIIPITLALITKKKRPYIVHQSGKNNISLLIENYERAGFKENTHDKLGIKLIPFINNIANEYANADLVICRSGAMTVSEISAVGVAALFIPFPFSSNNHQIKNAEFLVKEGAAFMMHEKDLSPKILAKWISSLTREFLLEIAQKAFKFSKLDSTDKIIKICLSQKK